uniref:Rrp44-like cold shock domain n=1 Tax=Ackermannviridae sp. TaxID=2831612 RepID=A0A8S5RQT0_9CAUD|nr:MAG TPA: Rrp44-like cold shock domain [Ackermannviridae sp.]
MRTCYPQRVRSAQHTPTGRVRGILRERWRCV